ncbi:cGMP-dependent protein kinase [Aureococcus anophagefferens]|nr:cGMP-dependent protein kinase [Aureococcus anophagefferens]
MPQRSAAEQRKVDRKVAKRAEEAAECKRLKDEHDDFKNSDAAPGPHRDKKLKKLYDDWYDYYAATDNGKRQIKREEQNSLSNNLHKKLEARRPRSGRRRRSRSARRGARLEQAVAAEEDTPAAQKRRWTEARTARTLLELEEYLEDELCGGGPDHVFLLETAINGQEELMAKRERWQDQRDERRRVECAVELLKDERTKIMAGDEMIGDRTDPWHVASYDQGIAALEEFLKPSARPAAAQRERERRRAATATHKALADELAVLLGSEGGRGGVADLTARVQAAWLKTGAGYYAARALADLEAEIRASAGAQKEIRAGRRVYIGNARYAQMLKEAKCVPRRKCRGQGPARRALPWDRFFFKSFDRIAETVVGNVAEKYAMNLLANHEDVELDDFAYDRFGSGGVHHDEALGDTGLYVLSLEPRATDTTRPSRYILGREVKFSAEFEAELKEADFSAEGSPVYRVYTRGTWTVFTYKRKPDSPFNGLQKFKWGSSAVARAKAQAKIDEKSVKGNYVVVGSDSWV